MEVNFSYYIEHYFTMPECLYFFLLALGVLFVLFVLLYVNTLIKARGLTGMERHEYIRINWHILVERYYEMVFSGTSILFFMDVYYLIDRFVTMEPYRGMWEKYDDFILLALIFFSCMLNSFFDRVFIRMKYVTRDEKSSGRLTGMVYMILIFIYIKFIYQNNNYDKLISYFITLMVGRFAYFDSTIHDFIKAMKGVVKNLWLLLFLLIYISVMSLYGFESKYLLTHNGVITNIFFTHLFMCVAIFVLYHIHIAELVTGSGDRTSKVLQKNPGVKREPQNVRIPLQNQQQQYRDDYYFDDDTEYEENGYDSGYDNRGNLQ